MCKLLPNKQKKRKKNLNALRTTDFIEGKNKWLKCKKKKWNVIYLVVSRIDKNKNNYWLNNVLCMQLIEWEKRARWWQPLCLVIAISSIFFFQITDWPPNSSVSYTKLFVCEFSLMPYNNEASLYVVSKVWRFCVVLYLVIFSFCRTILE